MVIRGSVKDIIQTEINLLTAKIGTLHDLSLGPSSEDATWAEVVARKTEFPSTAPYFSPCRLPATNNCFNPLYCEKAAANAPEPKSPNHVQHLTKKKVKKIPSFSNNPRKVLILGDSHTRGCAQEVLHDLNRNFSVQGIVKPGATMKDIVSSPTNIANNFYTKDTVVIWSVTRDIGRNESNHSPREIKKFAQAHSNSAPCRYDLSQTSCVNKEVKVFNRKLQIP